MRRVSATHKLPTRWFHPAPPCLCIVFVTFPLGIRAYTARTCTRDVSRVPKHSYCQLFADGSLGVSSRRWRRPTRVKHGVIYHGNMRVGEGWLEGYRQGREQVWWSNCADMCKWLNEQSGEIPSRRVMRHKWRVNCHHNTHQSTVDGSRAYLWSSLQN